MSRLNRRPTKVIEEPEPVAVTRAKRFYTKQQPKAPQVVSASTAPEGIFYQQEVAAYRLPRSLWEPSASNAAVADGRTATLTLDSALRGAQNMIEKGFTQLKIAVSEIDKLQEQDSDRYKGFVEGITKSKGRIAYSLWTELVLGRNGILGTLAGINNMMDHVNGWMAVHADGEDNWSTQLSKFISGEEDSVSGETIMRTLQELKRKQGNAMLLKTRVHELSNRIAASKKGEEEAEAMEHQRMQELEALVKKQKNELSALLDKHHNDLRSKTEEITAKRNEIVNDALKVEQEATKTVNEAAKDVATDVADYAKFTLKSSAVKSSEPAEDPSPVDNNIDPTL